MLQGIYLHRYVTIDDQKETETPRNETKEKEA